MQSSQRHVAVQNTVPGFEYRRTETGNYFTNYAYICMLTKDVIQEWTAWEIAHLLGSSRIWMIWNALDVSYVGVLLPWLVSFCISEF